MLLPVFAYGFPVLRKVCTDITSDYPGLQQLISDMFETASFAKGVGLAAPQIGIPIRLFIIDTTDIDEKERQEKTEPVKKVFINARMLEETGEEWKYNEGCLSIPKIREDVIRKLAIRIKYLDEKFIPHAETFTDIPARIIQHEYDHIEGKLFIDRLSPLRRALLKGRLTDIVKGKVQVDYKIKFHTSKI